LSERIRGNLRTNLIWAAAVISMALLEAQWPYVLRVQGVVPQLVLILVVFFAIVDGEDRAMFTGLLGGIFQEVATDDALGHRVFCLVVVGYVTGAMARRLITENPAVKASAVFVSSVVHGLLYLAIDYVQRPGVSNTSGQIAALLPQAFYTALLTPLLFMLLSVTPMPQQRRAT
jgi:rod shape-determining protein MreD